MTRGRCNGRLWPFRPCREVAEAHFRRELGAAAPIHHSEVDNAYDDQVLVSRRWGNAAIRTGKVEKVFQQLIEDLKPEAAYFHAVDGDRGGFFVVNMQESSQIAEIAERLFFGVSAKIELVPVMTADDLRKGLSGVQATIQRYG